MIELFCWQGIVPSNCSSQFSAWSRTSIFNHTHKFSDTSTPSLASMTVQVAGWFLLGFGCFGCRTSTFFSYSSPSNLKLSRTIGINLIAASSIYLATWQKLKSKILTFQWLPMDSPLVFIDEMPIFTSWKQPTNQPHQPMAIHRGLGVARLQIGWSPQQTVGSWKGGRHRKLPSWMPSLMTWKISSWIGNEAEKNINNQQKMAVCGLVIAGL